MMLLHSWQHLVYLNDKYHDDTKQSSTIIHLQQQTHTIASDHQEQLPSLFKHIIDNNKNDEDNHP
jgi:hypothetical protein